ncbi:MAG: type II toxin-antitoxin system RelE/ParE family toxin [Ancylobacter novellus]|uniref:Type II toxin-antitoxin system RelE/ParE family toxin n=1 Tax=Ancylobacter novellus TaxID=921 RepID=A0A2W5KG38_ANCNO|nr:MAG: type II toxin-antitoxin system RelE/ParE family toxin [Ancylobacter novellus]
MRIVYSEIARRDIDGILATTFDRFGDRQMDVYADLLKGAVALVLENPARPSSLDRSEFLTGLRSIHVSLAARARRRAAHQIFYRVGRSANGFARLEIIRVLHESMDAAAHIAAGVGSLPSE